MSNARAIRGEPTPIRIPLSEIGGGTVIQAFYTYRDGRRVRIERGTRLTLEEIRAIGAANRSSLLGRFIAVWPKTGQAESFVASRAPAATAERPERHERHVVALGFGRYDVIEGVKINTDALDRAAAYALAGKAEPEKKRA